MNYRSDFSINIDDVFASSDSSESRRFLFELCRFRAACRSFHSVLALVPTLCCTLHLATFAQCWYALLVFWSILFHSFSLLWHWGTHFFIFVLSLLSPLIAFLFFHRFENVCIVSFHAAWLPLITLLMICPFSFLCFVFPAEFLGCWCLWATFIQISPSFSFLPSHLAFLHAPSVHGATCVSRCRQVTRGRRELLGSVSCRIWSRVRTSVFWSPSVFHLFFVCIFIIDVSTRCVDLVLCSKGWFHKLCFDNHHFDLIFFCICRCLPILSISCDPYRWIEGIDIYREK